MVAEPTRFKLGLMAPTVEGWFGPGRSARWSDLRALAQTAEAVGFDALWVADHFLYRNTPTERMTPDGESRGLWEAWTLLSGLAAATTRLELGPLVACTTFRNPALLVKMAATFEEVSDGRLLLGLGAGWVPVEHAAFGFPYGSPRERVDRFAETLAIIAPLLRDGHVDFVGQHYQARNCELRPRGPRPAGPPIVIGAKRARMLRLAAQYADATDTDFHLDTATLPERVNEIDAACRQVGRDPTTMRKYAAIRVALLADDSGAVERRWFDVNGLPREAIAGGPATLTAYFRRYQTAGADMLTIQVVNFTGVEVVERFGPIVAALR